MDGKCLVQRILSVIGLVTLGIFIYNIDLKSMFEVVRNFPFLLIITIFLIIISHVVIRSFRWKALIFMMNGKKIDLKFSILSVIAGISSGSIIPGRIEMAKSIMLKEKEDVPMSASLSALFIERICDFLAFLFIILLSLSFIPIQKTAKISTMVLILTVVLAIVLALILFSNRYHRLGGFIISKIPFPQKIKIRIENFFKNFFTTFSTLRNKNLLLFLLLFSAIAIILEVVQFHLILRSFGINVSFFLSAFILTGTTILGVLSMIPGGTGIVEVSTTAMLGIFVSGSETSIQSAVLFNRIFGYYLLVVIGALILVFYRKIFGKTLRFESKKHKILK